MRRSEAGRLPLSYATSAPKRHTSCFLVSARWAPSHRLSWPAQGHVALAFAHTHSYVGAQTAHTLLPPVRVLGRLPIVRLCQHRVMLPCLLPTPTVGLGQSNVCRRRARTPRLHTIGFAQATDCRSQPAHAPPCGRSPASSAAGPPFAQVARGWLQQHCVMPARYCDCCRRPRLTSTVKTPGPKPPAPCSQ